MFAIRSSAGCTPLVPEGAVGAAELLCRADVARRSLLRGEGDGASCLAAEGTGVLRCGGAGGNAVVDAFPRVSLSWPSGCCTAAMGVAAVVTAKDFTCSISSSSSLHERSS